MTCIAAIRTNDGVWIGGDSAGVAGLSLSIRSDPKVFHNGPFIIGGTSSFRMLQLLRYKFVPPKQNVNQTDYQYMVTDFIDSARRCFAENGFGDKDATVGGSFIVGYNGNLYAIESDYQVGILSFQYDACGCGADLALGSLFSTSNMKLTPEERITLALNAAATHSAGVSAPFAIVHQPNPNASKTVKSSTKPRTKKQSS